MNLDEINGQLKQIEQMLGEIELENVNGESPEEIRKMADNPIEHTNQFIQQALTEGFLEAEHLEVLASIYTKTQTRLSEINLENAGKDEKYVITKISEKADEFESKRKAYEEATAEYDPQKTLDKEEEERAKLQEEVDNDLAIVEGIEILNNRCKKHIETFQEAYAIYVEAMEKSGLSDKDIKDEEIADEYKKEIDQIDQEIANLPPNDITDARREGLQNDIKNYENELEILENNGITGERPNPLLQKSDENKWNKRDDLLKNIKAAKMELDSPAKDTKEWERLKNRRKQVLSNGKIDYRQKQSVICKSQKSTMNKAINSMRGDLNKKNKYSEKFVAYMGEQLNEAENNGEYDKVSNAITEVGKRIEDVVEKQEKVAQKQKNIDRLQLGIEQNKPKKEQETRSTVTATRTESVSQKSTRTDTSTQSTEIKKLTYWEKQKATYEKMKSAEGKKRFSPILWFKSLSPKYIEAWEKGYIVAPKVQPTEEQIAEAKKDVESRRDAFARSLLYNVAQQSGPNISISEEAKEKAYKEAQEVEDERE